MMVLEKTLKSPLYCKEIQPVHPKGEQCWVFIGRTDVEAETPVLWPPDAQSWLIGKDPGAGKDWGQEEKGSRGWGGWMASLTQWTWVCVNSGRWWWTGRPGVLWFMGSPSQTRLSDWTELNWSIFYFCTFLCVSLSFFSLYICVCVCVCILRDHAVQSMQDFINSPPTRDWNHTPCSGREEDS